MFIYLAAGLVPIVFLAVILLKRLSAPGRAKAVTAGLLTVNAGVVLAVLIMLLGAAPVSAQEAGQAEAPQVEEATGGVTSSGAAIGAGLAVGLAAIGAGISVGITGSAAIGGITQKPELLGRTLIYVGLAEGVAIYGLIVAFMILTGALG